MEEVRSAENLIDELRSLGARCIGVDGSDGVGKSTLSEAIATKMGLPLFSLDDYLDRGQGGFLEFLRYTLLRDALNAAPCFVVEGICLLQVLERVRVQVDTLVYVKRYHSGFWSDERELNLMEPLEQFLASERKLLVLIEGDSAADSSLGITEEIIRYHHAYTPFGRAQVIYRVEH